MRRVWKAVQLFLGFHVAPDGLRRARPYIWRPKNGNAGISNPEDTEVFCVVSAASGRSEDDVQIKLHPDKIVLRRSQGDGWRGVLVGECSIQVCTPDGVWVTVAHDGTVCRRSDVDTTYIEVDGSVLKETPYVKAMMSGDGEVLSSSTPDRLARISPDSVFSSPKTGANGNS